MTVMDDSSVNLKTQLGGKGRAILTSSSSTQFSFQPDGEMSIYTRYLVEGIETGAADKDKDSKISVDELHEYAALKVSQESPNMTPAFYPVEQGGKIYIAKVTQAKDDPRLVYRRELESRMVDENFSFSASELEKNIDKDLISILFKSMWSPAARRILDKLGLSEVESEQIKIEVLKPILAKARKLIEYEELLKEMLPPTTQELKDLRDYQKDHLGLRDEDVMDIDNRHGLTIITTMPMKESQPLTIDLGSGVTLELVRVPAGKFMMGSDESDSEKPIHEVKLKEFLIGKYAVTNAQWQAVMKAKGSANQDKKFQGDLQPVVGVSWHESREFCKKLAQQAGREVRLPTEAEWEYACRAGTNTPFAFGETISPELVNYDGNYPYGDAPKGEYRKKTVDVNAFYPNGWGLYQMHGNVTEWCLDEWHDNYSAKPSDLKRTGDRAWGDINVNESDNRSRLLRGGSWVNGANGCRYGNVGFRVVVVSFP
jgi:formylglycine-generating enzyme required for sulfatase activity